MLDGIIDGRHDGGNHDSLHRLHVQVVITEQIGHNDAILIGSHRRICRTAPALHQAAALKHGGLDIRVADIHCNDHMLYPLTVCSLSKIHSAPAERRAFSGQATDESLNDGRSYGPSLSEARRR